MWTWAWCLDEFLPSNRTEDGGELEVHSYPLEQVHIVCMSVNIISTAEGLEPHQLLMGMDGDVGVIFNHASSLCRRVARLLTAVRWRHIGRRLWWVERHRVTPSVRAWVMARIARRELLHSTECLPHPTQYSQQQSTNKRPKHPRF
jgi:hypothetical protein